MTQFDPLKAQREIVAGLRDIHALLQTRAREAQGKLAEAEMTASAMMKLERFAQQHLEAETLKLRAMQ